MSAQVIAVVATLIGIAVGVATLGGMMWRRLGPVVEMAQQLHGEDGDERRGIAARPGILERQTTTERLVTEQAAELAALRADLHEVVSQLRHNGGSSLLDIVDKTYAAVQAASAQ